MQVRLAASVVLSCIVASAVPAAAGGFPARPHHVALRTLDGTLEDYHVGDTSGWFALRTAGERIVRIVAGAHLTIDGVRVACRDLHDPPHCSDWPPNLVLRQTRVVVTVWPDISGGRRILASDQIRTQ